MILPKLSFTDILNKAPKPKKEAPKPQVAPLIYVEQSEYGSLQEYNLKPEISHFSNDGYIKMIDEDGSQSYAPYGSSIEIPNLLKNLTQQNSIAGTALIS